MNNKKVLDEGRQLKRLNAETRRQSHMYKWLRLSLPSIAFWLFSMIRTCAISFFPPGFASFVLFCGSKDGINRVSTAGSGMKNTILMIKRPDNFKGFAPRQPSQKSFRIN